MNNRNEVSATAVRRVFFLVLPVLVIVGGLIAYKTSASLAVITKVSATGVFTPRGNVIPHVGASGADIATRTWNYFLTIWPALVFGILISGAVSTFISPQWLARLLGRRSLRSQAIAGLAGAPLMLCSCCVAPVFTGVYERSARLGPSLGLILAAPALNPAALILTFMLFGSTVGTVRLGAALVMVLFTGLIADRILGQTKVACESSDPESEVQQVDVLLFLRACAKVTVRLVPIIIVGVFLSMMIAQFIPVRTFESTPAKLLAIVLVATFAVPLALPTFFEIPLALILLSSGAPLGATAALLIAGPSINLPSLFTIMRTTNWKVAALVAISVWSVAIAAGLVVSLL